MQEEPFSFGRVWLFPPLGRDGRHKRSRRQIQDETEETGACKICITLILDSKTQRCGAGGRAARRGMGSLSTLS